MKQDPQLVSQMIASLRSLLRGESSRQTVQARMRERAPAYPEQAFTEHETARLVFDSLCAADEKDLDGEPVVREGDLESYLQWLLYGFGPQKWDLLVGLSMPLADLLDRTGVRAARFLHPGISWQETGTFTSRATGRIFGFQTPSPEVGFQLPEPSIHIAVAVGEDRLTALADLFETLAIDHRDCRFAEIPPGLGRWQIWRTDDHGNDFLVEEFTGRSKAEAQMRRFEESRHRQHYFLRELGAGEGEE